MNWFIFSLGIFYIVSGTLLILNKSMNRPATVLMGAPLLWTGFLNLMFLVVDFPHQFIWLSQMSFLLAIILVNLAYRGKK
jgi:hypothetical protein